MMKSEPRPFASLSSGLLARKGAARPAMRPQGFGQGGSGLEDLGWNDMGFDPPRPALAPVEALAEPVASSRPNPAAGLTPASPVHAVHEELAQRLGHEPGDDAEETIDEMAGPVAANPEPVAELLAMSPVPEPVVEPIEAPLAKAKAKPDAPVARAPAIRATPQPRARRQAGSGAKAAFTLRLDGDRHLKLRLACAVTGTSAQQLVTRALDALLGGMPEVDAMAERASERGETKR